MSLRSEFLIFRPIPKAPMGLDVLSNMDDATSFLRKMVCVPILKQWNKPVGLTYGGYEIAFDVIKRAQTLDKEKIREALAKTDLNTVFGHIKFNEKHYCEIPLVGGQWVKGKGVPWDLEIVYNKNNPQIKKTAEMIFPLP